MFSLYEGLTKLSVFGFSGINRKKLSFKGLISQILKQRTKCLLMMILFLLFLHPLCIILVAQYEAERFYST